ncbi:MAG TPA: cellulase family glycosylhydrolase, partial [Solirubrobacteraceae bacterium]|nr:cellulase family glycosylhydrolase [Solirubrobacteraceae bacterium]
ERWAWPSRTMTRQGGTGLRQRRGFRWLLPAILGTTLTVVVPLLGGASGRAAQAPLEISISGNHFVNGLNGVGQKIQLRGVNVSSSEYACVDGYGYDDGDYTDATAAEIAAWGANVVRIPLNEDCWLGVNLPNEDPYGGSGYQHEIESFVSDLNAHGIYAILDLHWTAPGSQTALEQQPMPDMDHSPAFWTSVATAFKSNQAVMFDLFNEPYDPTDMRSGDDPNSGDAVTWECWATGKVPDPIGGNAPPVPCYTQAYDDSSPDPQPTSRYEVAGMQTLLSDIRNVGATQPILVGGLDFANDLGDTDDANGNGQGWMQHAPDDPLDQEAASFHNYQGEGCQTQSCWDSSIKAVAANVPVITGEFAEDNYTAAGCSPNSGATTFDDQYMDWADTNGVSYVAWVWLVDDPPTPDDDGCDRHGLLSSYDGTPIAPNGTAVHDHLAALAAGATSTTTSTTTGTGSGSATGGGNSNAKPAVKLLSFKAAVQSGGSTVKFRLRSAQKCSGTIAAQTLNAYRVAEAKHKAAKVPLGSARFMLTAGKTKTGVLKLAKAFRKLLTTKRSLKVEFTITLNSTGYHRTVLHRTTTLHGRR